MRLRICLKEVRESRLWLRLLKGYINHPQRAQEWHRLIDESEQLVKIFSVGIRTTLQKMKESIPETTL
jgi:hypothetical protein